MEFNPWELVAGLGFFLLGMMNIEQALETLGDRSFRRVLRERTNTPLRGVLVGIVATICLQSSTLVGLIVLAFVGTGILKMANALGVIFGANLGTTFTSWVVAMVGFEFDLAEYALPLVAIGALGTFFLSVEHRLRSWSLLLLGFGFLLLGLELMKTSMGFLSEQITPATFRDYPLVLYVLGGVILTALIQSSTATTMIVLSAIHAGVLPLTTAAGIVIGANIGTTLTMLIGSAKGSPDKRRVALAHLLFNVVTGVFALLLLIPLLYFLTELLGLRDPMYALAAFHSLFNLLGILLFSPFIPQFSRWLQNRFTEQHNHGCRYITKVPANVSDAAVEALGMETLRLLHKVVVLNLRVLKIQPEPLLTDYQALAVYQEMSQQKLLYDEQYTDIKHSEQEILNYANKVIQEISAPEDAAKISTLLHGVRNLVYSAKSLKDIRQNLAELRHYAEDEKFIETICHDAKIVYRHLLDLVEKTDPLLVEEKTTQLNQDINNSHARLHQLISHYQQQPDSGILLSTLFNVNRELLVSHQALATVAAELTAN